MALGKGETPPSPEWWERKELTGNSATQFSFSYIGSMWIIINSNAGRLVHNLIPSPFEMDGRRGCLAFIVLLSAFETFAETPKITGSM